MNQTNLHQPILDKLWDLVDEAIDDLNPGLTNDGLMDAVEDGDKRQEAKDELVKSMEEM
jgi:hypothetical protein